MSGYGIIIAVTLLSVSVMLACNNENSVPISNLALSYGYSTAIINSEILGLSASQSSCSQQYLKLLSSMQAPMQMVGGLIGTASSIYWYC